MKLCRNVYFCLINTKKMRKIFTFLITAILGILMLLPMTSCQKKNVNKIAVDTEFAVALLNDTLTISELMNEMDSTTNNWLRIRNDSIFAYYGDTINNVVSASKFLSNIKDVSFNTATSFTLPPIVGGVESDTTLYAERFATIPFHYEGFEINEVLLRSGSLEFDFDLNPAIPMLKKIVIYSEQLEMPDGEMFEIEFTFPGNAECSVNLADCKIIPDNDTVAFSSKIIFHYSPDMGFTGGEYNCELNGGISSVMFNTVYGIITKSMDSVFSDQVLIDFGINGLSGSCYLPVPTVQISYQNTFGLGAVADITQLDLVNTRTGLITDMLAEEQVEVVVDPTNGEYISTRIDGFTDQIDLLAGYTRLDFAGDVMMVGQENGAITISDTSTVNIVGEVEMPVSFKMSDIRYTDTLDVNFSGYDQEDIETVEELFEEIDFLVDYNSKIKINLDMQIYLMRNNTVIDSLFNCTQSLNYSTGSDLSSLDIDAITGHKLRNFLRANKMIVNVGASTESISPEPVMMMDTDGLYLIIRVLTKMNEIDFDDLTTK